MHALLAIDGSTEAFGGARFLAQLPFRSKPKVFICSVLTNHQVDLLATASGVQLLEMEKKTAQQNLQTAKEILEQAGYETEQILAQGHPSQYILETAKGLDADLVVMGARGHSAAYRVILGSTANFVANHSKCSVLIVRPSVKEDGPSDAVAAKSILVAFDGSPPSKLAYAQQSEFDWPVSTSIHVSTMIERPPLLPDDVVYDPDTLSKAEIEIAEMCATRSARCNSTYSVCETTHVASALADLAEKKECDLVFVGDTGKSAISRFFLGSTSRYVLHHAKCSIWIARQKAWA